MALKQRQRTFIPNPILGNQGMLAGAVSTGGSSFQAVPQTHVLTGFPTGGVQCTRVWLRNTAIDVATGASAFGSAELVVMPANRDLMIIGTKIRGKTAEGGGMVLLGFDVNAGSSITVGIGTAAASNVTLSGTMIDVLQLVTGVNSSSGLGDIYGASTVAPKTYAGAAARKFYLNVAGANTTTTASLIFAGPTFVDFYWIDMGPS